MNMDERIFTSTQIVKVLDKNRRNLTYRRECGFITEDQEKGQAEMIAGLAAEFGLFSEYAFYQPQEPV